MIDDFNKMRDELIDIIKRAGSGGQSEGSKRLHAAIRDVFCIKRPFDGCEISRVQVYMANALWCDLDADDKASLFASFLVPGAPADGVILVLSGSELRVKVSFACAIGSVIIVRLLPIEGQHHEGKAYRLMVRPQENKQPVSELLLSAIFGRVA